MTTRTHRSVLAVLALASALLLSFALGSLYDVGRAQADNVALADAGATAITDAGAGSGSGSATPADKLHDPVAEPMAAFDDVVAMKKIGWPLALLGALIMLARGVQSAAKRWPTVKALAWLGTGVRAFVIAGVITVSTASFNALATGGTWFAVAMAAFGAFLALLAPAPKPAGS